MAWLSEYAATAMAVVSRAPRKRRRKLRSRVFTPVVKPGFRSLTVAARNGVAARKKGRRRGRKGRAGRSFVVLPTWNRRYYTALRGMYRVFNDAEYRFYRSDSGPPAESDSPFATNATLPYTPTDTYGNGTWYLSVSYFNGVIDSGFLPLGPNGETCLRIDIAAGEETGSPPNAPNNWNLELRAGGVVRVNAFYLQLGDLRATQWAITYTTDGSTPGEPPAVSPDVTVAMAAAGIAELAYDLPAVEYGSTVKVRLQTRRLDGETWKYSEGSTVETTAYVAGSGELAPSSGDRWPGRLPEEF